MPPLPSAPAATSVAPHGHRRRVRTLPLAGAMRPWRAAFLALAGLVLAACGDASTESGRPSTPATETYATALGVNIGAMIKKSDNLYYQDLVVGTGAEAITGRTLGMTYSGWLANGTPFDSNVGGANFVFGLGGGQVIGGWDQGIVGMKVGGRRRLVIGSALGYGSRGQGAIPPNATLVFVVELKTLQ